jgi:drug/metabolite transporter (DMT)-like permease
VKLRSPAPVLAAALVGISFAGPLVKLSTADPLAVAAWRLGFSLVIVAAALALTGEWRQLRTLRRGEAMLGCSAGLALALHFWAWNASIHLTTVAASVTLVNLQPAFVVAISAMFLGESPSRRQLIGILIAIAGALIIAYPDFHTGAALSAQRPAAGNLLAVSAAVTAAIYYTIGRKLRARYDIWSYVAVAYGACFVVLLAFAAFSGTRLTPQPARELSIFAALALGPMLLGHTGLNWALGYLPAYVVNLVVLGEPVGATLIAAFLPGIRQVPPLITLIGGAVILIGVVICASGRSRLRTDLALATETQRHKEQQEIV